MVATCPDLRRTEGQTIFKGEKFQFKLLLYLQVSFSAIECSYGSFVHAISLLSNKKNLKKNCKGTVIKEISMMRAV